MVEFSGNESLQTSDNFLFRQTFSGPTFDVSNRGWVPAHANNDDPVECRVGLTVATSVEAVAPARLAGPGRNGTDTAELRERGLRSNPVGVVAGGDQHLCAGVETDAESFQQLRSSSGDEPFQLLRVDS